MSKEHIQQFLIQDKNSRDSEDRKSHLIQILELVLKECNRGAGAKNGAIYLLQNDNSLVYINQILNTNIGEHLTRLCVKNSENLFIKKKEPIPGLKNSNSEESYICAFIGSHDGSLNIGAIVLEGNKDFNNFSQNDFELICLYSKTISILFQESYYFENESELYLRFSSSILLHLHSIESFRKNKRLEYLLNEIIRVSGLINSSMHLTTLLKEVMESVKSVFKTESCSILLVDKSANELYFHIVAGEKEEEISKIRVPMGKGIAGTVAITREPMIINDAQNDSRVYKVVDEKVKFITRNIIASALVANNEVIGVMEAINTIDRNNFDQSDIELFLSFSDAAALAIQKTRLLEDLERTNKELEKKLSELASLFDMGQAVMESKTAEELFFKSLQIIARELDCRKAIVLIVDKKQETLQIQYVMDGKEGKEVHPFPSDSIIVHSILYNKIILKSEYDYFDDTNDLDQKFIKGSFIILPLVIERPFGAICISDRLDNATFTHGHLRLFQTISTQLLKGYENLKLNEDMIAKKAIEKELDITRGIQKNILPSNLPVGSNFELGVKFVPAKEVSGDFYDFYKYSDGQYSFLIADVSGKSLPAAIFMAMSSSIMRTISRNHDIAPAEILKQANALIYEDSQSGMFVTLFFIHYNPSTSEIEFASAGHNDQIWIKSDGSHEFIKGTGAPLGVIPTGKYIGGRFKIKPGELIALYTDGAIEEKNHKDEEYGLDRLVYEIIQRKDKHPKIIVEEIYKDVMSFSGTNTQYDDFTMLIIKFNDDYQFRRTFHAVSSEISKLRDFLVETIINVRNLEQYISDDILLCCDEAATNIIMHSYKNSTIKNPSFECAVKFVDDRVHIMFKDRGVIFDKSKVQKPSLEANLKGERKGGFGVFLIEKLMDKVLYLHENGENILIIEKKIE